MIGGFFDRHHAAWDEAAFEWFEALLEEDDVDVMAWALGRGCCARAISRRSSPQALQRLDYVTI